VQETSGATILANILPGVGIDEFLTRTDVVAGITSNFLTDALGSPVAVTDNAGAVQTEYTYEPFGKTTPGGASNSSSYQYTGRENDGTGLYYYRARYYQSELKRFISEDPIEFAGGDVNLYAYVLNSPVNFTDPSGESVGTVCRALANRLKFHLRAVVIYICEAISGEQGPRPPNIPPRTPPAATAPKEGPKGVVPPVPPGNPPPPCGRKDCPEPDPPFPDECYESGWCI